MNIENECKDARDVYSRTRKTGGNMDHILEGLAFEGQAADIDSLDWQQ